MNSKHTKNNITKQIIAKPHRLDKECYIGQQVYFITIVCYQRQKIFKDKNVINFVKKILNYKMKKYKFENVLTVFMHDHVHLILKGLDDNSNLHNFLKTFKYNVTKAYQERISKRNIHVAQSEWRVINNAVSTTTTTDNKKSLSIKFWHRDYYDHIIRSEEALPMIIRYVIENPVRKEYVKHYLDWEYSYSDKYSLKEFVDVFYTDRLEIDEL